LFGKSKGKACLGARGTVKETDLKEIQMVQN